MALIMIMELSYSIHACFGPPAITCSGPEGVCPDGMYKLASKR